MWQGSMEADSTAAGMHGRWLHCVGNQEAENREEER